ncbi:fluoride efflux transporter CrcB [Corallincola luteus]|uniref:Fluoride-specific ion channel FluC n=1 Tax=Corallincola luteus TaxID=1775177 RepID=A0ABY2AP39_9GAMM|nr:fluoride efflux transporter CrcB [Corallincola luteus]TCI04787.1 fluoride efflux transporter CrcB [Corallincola luteus]
MSQWTTLAFVALGGAFGACSRFLVSQWCVALFGKGFPYGTLTVNIAGSLMMGGLFALLENGTLVAAPWRPVVGLGFLGALTTFSTFSMDNVVLMQQGEWLKFAMNIGLNVVGCVFAAWAGYQLFAKSAGV